MSKLHKVHTDKSKQKDVVLESENNKYIPISVDAMFSKVMKNEEACIQTLEAILGFEIEKIEYINQQQEIGTGIKSKGIRADVYAKEGNKVYDIEMQNYSKPDLVKRMRYYQAAIDTCELEKGRSYTDLPETFIIFICTFDMFGKDYAKYEFEVNCINHKNVEIEFDQHFIVLNTRAYKNLEYSPLRSLLEYINNGTVNSDKLSKILDGLVKGINEDKRWVSSVWEGLTKEEIWAIDLKACRQRAEEAETALRAAEAKAKQAEASAKQAETKAKQVEVKAKEARSKFIDMLLDQNRIDDLKRASKDPDFRQKLMNELDSL